eukprot:4046814-Pyramimonas_sp.AAC.1
MATTATTITTAITTILKQSFTLTSEFGPSGAPVELLEGRLPRAYIGALTCLASGRLNRLRRDDSTELPRGGLVGLWGAAFGPPGTVLGHLGKFSRRLETLLRPSRIP